MDDSERVVADGPCLVCLLIAGTYDGGVVGYELQPDHILQHALEPISASSNSEDDEQRWDSDTELPEKDVIGSGNDADNSIIVSRKEEGKIDLEAEGNRIEECEDELYGAKRIFATSLHTGCIRAITAVGEFLCTGGTDEIIRVVNLSNRRVVGNLTVHAEDITALELFGVPRRDCAGVDIHAQGLSSSSSASVTKPLYLLSGGSDGQLCLWRCRDWSLIQTWKLHTGAIHCVRFHPSGRMALSVGQDCSLRLWDFTKATCAVTHHLPRAATVVEWDPSGSYYSVMCLSEITVYDASTSQCGSICLPSSNSSSSTTGSALLFLKPDLLVVGDSKGRVLLVRIEIGSAGQPSLSFNLSLTVAHAARIRGFAVLVDNSKELAFTSADADGNLVFWRLDQPICKKREGEVYPSAVLSTETRLTCIASSAVCRQTN